MFEPVHAHREIGNGSNQQAAKASPDRIAWPTLFPDDGHAFDGHHNDNHWEQCDRQTGFETQLVRYDTDNEHQHDDNNQHGTESRYQQQPQAVEQEANTQPECDEKRKENYSPKQSRFAKRQRDQYRHEGAERIDADYVAHENHDQCADRNHQ